MRDSEVRITRNSNRNPTFENNKPYCNVVRDSDGNMIGVSFNNLHKGDNTEINY